MLAALIPFAAVIAVRWTDPPSAVEGDYAHYLLHARALSEGRSYSDIGYIYTQLNLVGPRLQPPGWPLFLSPFVAVFGTHSPVFRALLAVLVAAFGVTAGLYVTRRFGAVAGLVTTAFAPLALETQYATGSALSDPLFCLLVWLALLVAEADGPPTWRRGIVLAGLCAAILSVRMAGIALPPAILLFAIVRWRKEATKVVVPIGAMVLVAGIAGLALLDSLPFLDHALQTIAHAPATIPRLVAVYSQAVASSALYPFSSRSVDDAYHALVAVPLLIGAYLFLKQQLRSAAASFLLMYVVVLFLSPVREGRYFWPLVPLSAAMVTTGLLWLGARFAPLAARPAFPRYVMAFLGLVTVGAAWNLSRMPARPSIFSDPNTVSLFDWLKATSDTMPMRVVFTNPRVLTLETSIPAMGIPFGDPPTVVAEFDRKGITHVIVPRANITRNAERNLKTVVGARPEYFPTVFSNPSHEVHLFVARPSTASDSGPVRTAAAK